MRRTSLFVVLAAAWVGMSAATVSAQMWPGSRYRGGSYDSYDDDAVAAAAALNSADNAARNASQSFQAWSQQGMSQQMSGVQSGIRGAMDASAQQRTQDIYSRQQSNRDWWFQVEQQQAAQRRAQAQMPRYQYAAMPSGFEAAPAFNATNAPKAEDDIIKWLPLLQAPQFAAQRAQIEAPYRRSAKGLSSPTAADYQDMIKVAEQMKLTLKGMAADITAQQYLDAEAFLDKLAAEARERIEQLAPKK